MKSEIQEKIDDSWEQLNSGQDSVAISSVKELLDHVGLKLPNHKVRDILEEAQQTGIVVGNTVSKQEFEKLCQKIQDEETAVAKTFKTHKQHDKDAEKIEGLHGAHHMVLFEEQKAFSDWINSNLSSSPDVGHLLPLQSDGSDLYTKIDDGIILCKMINLASPETIDDRAINKGKNISIFKRHENLTLALRSAQGIGCNIVGIDSHNINSSQGKKWLVMGLIWQVIKLYLFNQITISNVPGLVNLLMDGEDISELMKLSPEQLLVRWVNYQLEKAGSSRRIKNFSDDIKDSEIYTDLISQIAPSDSKISKRHMNKDDLTDRAEGMLEQADKIDSRAFVTARDVVKGHEKLNLAFVANLFNNHPGLEPPEEDLDVIQETREEKTYRNWMNSLGVKPRVNYLYSDLYDGNIIFQIMDIIKPGIVNWKKVKTEETFSKMQAKKHQEVLGNCNYAVELGKKLNFVLVGIAGSDIMEGNKTLTLALIWQLMRAYTLSLLSQLNADGTPIVESEIISWANSRLEASGKGVQIKHFQDPVNKTALPIIHIINVIKAGVIDYSLVKMDGKLSGPDCLSNAKYAITMARKIGAPVYALPEDISEVKHKMLMTVYASLMLSDMN